MRLRVVVNRDVPQATVWNNNPFPLVVHWNGRSYNLRPWAITVFWLGDVL